MLDIKVTDDYKLLSDGMQIVVQKRYTVDPTKSPKFKDGDSTEKYEEFRTWKYCSKIEHALEMILRQRVFESDAKNIKELRDEIISFKQEIKTLLGGEIE